MPANVHIGGQGSILPWRNLVPEAAVGHSLNWRSLALTWDVPTPRGGGVQSGLGLIGATAPSVTGNAASHATYPVHS